MNLTEKKTLLFDMQWTDNADYEFVFEERLQDAMKPLFGFQEAEFTKEVDFESSYTPVAYVYATFRDDKSKYKFMLKYSDVLNELR